MPLPATTRARSVGSIGPRCMRLIQICSSLLTVKKEPATFYANRKNVAGSFLTPPNRDPAVGSPRADQRAAGSERRADAAARRQLTLHGAREVDAQAAVDGARLEFGVVAVRDRHRDAPIAGLDVEALAGPPFAA